MRKGVPEFAQRSKIMIVSRTVFHRTRLDLSLNGEAGEYLTLDGALRFNPSKGQIENV
jgi:hypothetical protein